MKKFAVVAGFLVALVAGSRSSFATIRTWRFSGSVCQAIASSRLQVEYNQYGVFNTGSTLATVICPLPLNNATSSLESMTNMLAVIVYNRSNTTNLTCTLLETDTTGGTVLFSQSMSLSPLGPGSSSRQFLFDPSSAGGAITGVWSLQCNLPAVQSGDFSIVSAITVQTTY